MLFNKVKSSIRKYNLITAGESILAGVSGGPDSVTLLLLLSGLKKEFNLKIYAAHLDHMLRKDSGKDALYVERLAAKLSLPFAFERINVRKFAGKGSLEEIAREFRLAFLFKTAKRFKANKIALGHNLDDQAETVLMRIIRGSGLYGLSGILPKRAIQGITIIRPLIEVSRKEIESFLRLKKIKPCRDLTNNEEIYFRNKIRHNLLPLLKKDYNVNISTVLSHMAESIGSDYDYLSISSRKLADRLGSKIGTAKFLRIHPSMKRLVIRQAIFGLQKDMRRITFRHIQEIEDMILNRPVNSVVDLPKSIQAVKRKDYFFFRKKVVFKPKSGYKKDDF